MTKFTLIAVLGLVLTGCGKKPAEEVADLKKVFNKPATGQASAEFDLLKGMVDQAINAAKDGDLSKAVVNLAVVRAQPSLNPEQREAIQEAMSAVQTSLAAKAEAGDAAAKQALEQYRLMKRR